MGWGSEWTTERALFLATFVSAVSASAQSFSADSITGGASEGSVSTYFQYSHVYSGDTVNHVLNGQHDGIECNMNMDCTIEVSGTFASSSFLESQSTIFLSYWSVETDDPDGDAIGRLKFRLMQTSYNPSTGAYAWTVALRLNTDRSGTFNAKYGFSIYRGKASTKNVITPNLSKQCTGYGGCSVAATANVLNVAPTSGQTFKGFMMTGFDVSSTDQNNYPLQRIAIDGSINAAGTSEGGYSAANNQKQGMSCTVILDESDPKEVSCTVYTAAFASDSGHKGYITTSDQFVTNHGYDPEFPDLNFWTYQEHSVPPVGGATFPGIFTPLKNFDLLYAYDVPLTRLMGAGCGQTDIDTSPSPDVGRAVVFGQISLDTDSTPDYAFNSAVECFSNWAMIWP